VVAAIGKHREGEQNRKRSESGVRLRARRSVQLRGSSPLASELSATSRALGSPDAPSSSAGLANEGHEPAPSFAWGDPSIHEDALHIERLLDQTGQCLSRMTQAPLRRELTLVVERYRHSVGEWAARAPTWVQRIILLDCVKALHDRVVSRTTRAPPTR
jgi:hypothetical protein